MLLLTLLYTVTKQKQYIYFNENGNKKLKNKLKQNSILCFEYFLYVIYLTETCFIYIHLQKSVYYYIFAIFLECLKGIFSVTVEWDSWSLSWRVVSFMIYLLSIFIYYICIDKLITQLNTRICKVFFVKLASLQNKNE